MLETDVNNRISRKTFAEAYEAATRGTKDKMLRNVSTKIARTASIRSVKTKSINSVVPMIDDEVEDHKTASKSVSTAPTKKHLASLRRTLEQQSDRIAEFQAYHHNSMIQLQEALKHFQ